MKSDGNPRPPMTSNRWVAWFQGRFRELGRRARRDWDKIVLAIVGLVVFFIIWHVGAVWADEPALPTPGKVFEALFKSFEEPDPKSFDPWTMQDHIWESVKKIFYGALLAFLLAVPLGLLVGFSRRTEAALLIPIELIRPIPPIAWLAFSIALFPTGVDVVFIILLGVFFPIFINTVDGVKKVDPMLVDAAETLGASRLQIFWKVILPATVPQMMTGVRVGVGVGWMTIVAAEMVGVKDGGLGWYIWTYGTLSRYEEMFAGMLMLGIISVVIARGLIWLERWLSK